MAKAKKKRVTVKVGGQQREQRFDLDASAETIKAWKTRTRAELDLDREDRDAEHPPPVRGTFETDLPRYLTLIEGRVSYKSDRSHLRAWLPFIGKLKRQAVTTMHTRTAFAAWLADGKSPRTLRHRRRVLRELYQTLDGVHAKPPIKGVKIPTPADPHPTPTPTATIRAVAKSLKKGKRHAKGYGGDSDKCYARFLVRATTGQRPSQIGRAIPSDVDLKRRIWFVRPGKGGHAIPLPLSDEAVWAWKVFIKVKAWGPFDARSFSKTIRRHGWPANVRPYNLRHTFAIDHLLAGTSIGNLQGLLGHAQIETTRKHYAPVLLALLRKTVDKRKLRLA